MLDSKAHKLLGADAEAVPPTVLQSRGDHNANFQDVEAIETTCALFTTLMTVTQVQAIEADARFWQMNGCKV